MSTPKKRKRILNPPTVKIPSPSTSAENARPAPATSRLEPPPERERSSRRRGRPLNIEHPGSSPERRSSPSVGLLYFLVFILVLSMAGVFYFTYQVGGKVLKLTEIEAERTEKIAALEAEIATLKEANESLREEVAEGVQRAENAAQVVADQMVTTREMFDRVMERIPDGIGSFILQPDTPPPPPESSPFFSERTIQEDVDLLKKKITDGFGRLIRISPPDGP